MVYNKLQMKEKINQMSIWTERNFVIFTLSTCFIGVITLMFIAFTEYQKAWILMLPFSLLLYISIKEYCNLKLMEHVKDTLEREV